MGVCSTDCQCPQISIFLFFLWGPPPSPPNLGWVVSPEAACDHVTSYSQGGYWDRNAARNFDWIFLKTKWLSFHALVLSEGWLLKNTIPVSNHHLRPRGWSHTLKMVAPGAWGPDDVTEQNTSYTPWAVKYELKQIPYTFSNTYFFIMNVLHT